MRAFHRLPSFVPLLAAGVFGYHQSGVIGSAPSADSLSMRDTAKTTAFVNVSVIPMDSERVLTGQTVIVHGGRIAEMGPASKVQVPAGAVQVDGKGEFLIPGLADTHMHIQMYDSAGAEDVLVLLVANGVTTIRNVDYLSKGGAFGWMKLRGEDLLQLRKRTASGELLGPRIYTSGPWTGEDGGDISNATELISAYKAAGYDFIKMHDEGKEAFDSVLAVAPKIGMPIMGHVPDGIPLQAALKGGYNCIEHLTGYLEYLTNVPDAYFKATLQNVADTSAIRAIALETKKAGVWNSPTLALMEISEKSVDTLLKFPDTRYVDSATLDFWKTLEGQSANSGWVGTIPLRKKIIKALQDVGAGLLSGTDASTPFMAPGFSLHRELEALAGAGLTPYQVLSTSTRNVALYFGTLADVGTITVGKRADLVLLHDNPLVDIRNTQKIDGVVVNGRWLPRTELDVRMNKIVGKLSAHMDLPPGSLR